MICHVNTKTGLGIHSGTKRPSAVAGLNTSKAYRECVDKLSFLPREMPSAILIRLTKYFKHTLF